MEDVKIPHRHAPQAPQLRRQKTQHIAFPEADPRDPVALNVR